MLARRSLSADRLPLRPAASTRRARGRVFALGTLSVVLGLGGCMRSEVEKKIAFSEADHAAWLAKGKAGIRGEGFLRRPDASLARCSGGIVYLVPATPYFLEWVEVYKSGARIANPQGLHEAHGKAIRKAQCDITGRFDFAELPAGKWLLVTRVTYQGRSGGDDSTLVSSVETKPGEVAQAILSNPNRI
jgi:hypothetical protein